MEEKITGKLRLHDHPLDGLPFELHKVTAAGVAIIRLVEKSSVKRRGFKVGDILHVPQDAFVRDGQAPPPAPAKG